MSDERLRPDEDIARLIQIAGRRPAVPVERIARVKATVLERWQEEVQRRRRRRGTWMAVAFAAAASLLLIVSLRGLGPGPAVPTPVRIAGTIDSIVGSAWVEVEPGAGDTAGTEAARLAQDLRSGVILVTGEDGRIGLRLSSGHAVRIDTGTRLRLIEPETVELEEGAIYVDSQRAERIAGRLGIRTPMGVVREIGTQYEVRLMPEGLRVRVRVRVREGEVTLDDGTLTRSVPTAAELLVDANGAATSRPIPIHGPEWDWIARVTIVPGLDGMSARRFLDWVARERGLRLVFATDELERDAGRIVLGGALGGLSLDEALDAVLPTCGMAFRVQEDLLLIEGLDDAD